MSTNNGRVVWAAGMLSFLAGCSGTYNVGVEPADGSSVGGVSVGGSSLSFAGGAPSNGGFASASGGATSGGTAGPAMPAPGPSYCGIGYQTRPTPEFAEPALVWQRIQLFLAPEKSRSPMLPAVTTRKWAGDLAMTVLDSLGDYNSPGMERFISSWLPGTPIASTWAALFSVKGATLTDLLTTNLVRDPGSGILTDDAMLNRGDFVEISARGAFLSSQLLCKPVPFPPAGVVNHSIVQPGQTRRQSLAQHGADPICAGCHALMDPLGFALDHFDDQGAYSDLDNGLPIDSSGSIQLNAGTISFDGANDLGKKLAAQCEVAQCLAKQLLTDAQNRAGLPPPTNPDSDPDQVDQVQPIAAAFAGANGDLRTLIREVVQSDAFLRAP